MSARIPPTPYDPIYYQDDLIPMHSQRYTRDSDSWPLAQAYPRMDVCWTKPRQTTRAPDLRGSGRP